MNRVIILLLVVLSGLFQAYGTIIKEYIIFPSASVSVRASEDLAQNILRLAEHGRIYTEKRPWEEIPRFWTARLSDQAFKKLLRNPLVFIIPGYFGYR